MPILPSHILPRHDPSSEWLADPCAQENYHWFWERRLIRRFLREVFLPRFTNLSCPSRERPMVFAESAYYQFLATDAVERRQYMLVDTAAFFRSVGLPSHVPRGLYEPGCSAGECLGSQLFHANSSQVRQIAHGLFRAHGIPTFTPRGPTFDVVKWADFFNASGVVILASPAYDKVQQARGIIDYSERRYGRDSSHGCRVETWNQRQWHIRSVPEITAESPCSKHHGQLLRNRMRPPPAPTAL